LVLAGTPSALIRKISGHKTAKMLDRYFHLFGSHMQDAVAVLGNVSAGAGASTRSISPGPATPKLHTVEKGAIIAAPVNDN
jgi:hypothetical protein